MNQLMPLSPTITLAQQLMSRASVTPEDKGCQELMIARLEAIGFTIERMRFGAVDNFGPAAAQKSAGLCRPYGRSAKWASGSVAHSTF